MLFVLVLSVSAASAVSEDIATEGAIDESDIDIVSVDEPEELSAVEVEEVVEESSTNDEVLKEAATVKNDTFFNYFENEGTLKSDVTNEELIFEGEFSDIPDVHYITIDKPIKLTGKNAVLKNIAIVIGSGDVTLDSFTINTEDATGAITITDGNNVNITNNIINFIGIEEDNTAYGIYADSVDNLNICANVITFTGKGNETGNKVLYLNDCVGAIIDGNKFDVTSPSSGYMVGVIDFSYGSNNLKFTNNNVVIAGNPTDMTINGLCFWGNNVTVSSNNITVSGNLYTYGIGAYGSESKVTDNKINVSSDMYYACGIDLEGISWTIVDKNEFIVSSTGAAYGIYSGMTSRGITGNYTNNNIDASSYFVVGIELGSIDENVIGNTISVKGNYTVGVGALACSAYDENWNPTPVPVKNRLVQNNIITSTGSNIGNTTVYESIPLITTGIYSIVGNITINNNKITTNGEYTVIFKNSTAPSTVTKNNLVAKSLSGDESVKVVGDVKVSDNTPTKTTPSNPQTPATSNKVVKKATKITAKKKTFKAKTKTKKYTITLKSGKKAIKNVWVTLKIKGKKVIKAKTNAKGKATFKIKTLKKKGKYTATIKFAGDKNYKATSKKVKITVKK